MDGQVTARTLVCVIPKDRNKQTETRTCIVICTPIGYKSLRSAFLAEFLGMMR